MRAESQRSKSRGCRRPGEWRSGQCAPPGIIKVHPAFSTNHITCLLQVNEAKPSFWLRRAGERTRVGAGLGSGSFRLAATSWCCKSGHGCSRPGHPSRRGRRLSHCVAARRHGVVVAATVLWLWSWPRAAAWLERTLGSGPLSLLQAVRWLDGVRIVGFIAGWGRRM